MWESSGDESEFIEVDIDKIDNRTFLKVESWLKGLQRELDICWRYLALKYENKYQDRYLLTIRSIDSNVLQNMPRQILEERIAIESAAIRVNPQITDLLVVPLYGDDPSYGVRELLQNALDACRERKVLEQERGKSSPPYFCITDNGIGMTKDVIVNYFLIAGSSYRNNSSWKKSFREKDVCRSGRFGVGVLTAFLLGYKIQVETLPMGEEKAYFYQIENNSYGQINIERRESRTETLIRNGGGTRILIEMDSKKANSMVSEIPLDYMAVTRLDTQLLWFEWYILDSPKLHYTIDNKEYKNNELTDHLYLKWQKEREWYELPCTSAFTKVYWVPCIVHNSVSQPTVVCCNGIVIESNVLWGGIIRPYNMHEHLMMPHNAVFGELSFRAIPGYVPPEPKSKRNTIFMDDKNAYFIPDNIETIPEVEDVLSDLLGQEVWIPYDLTERKKKFPWFFDPNDSILVKCQEQI